MGQDPRSPTAAYTGFLPGASLLPAVPSRALNVCLLLNLGCLLLTVSLLRAPGIFFPLYSVHSAAALGFFPLLVSPSSFCVCGFTHFYSSAAILIELGDRKEKTMYGHSAMTARRSNQSILKEISPGCSLEGLMLKLKLQYFGHLMQKDPDAGKD